MLKYERPFPYLLWKEKSDNGLKTALRLQNIKILDTVLIKNNHAIGRGKDTSLPQIEWFFYSEKKRSVLRRHAHNASMAAFHNHFIKEQKPQQDWNKAQQKLEESKPNLIGKKTILNNVKDLKTLQNGLVAMWRWQKKYVEREDTPMERDQAVIDSQELTDITNDL